MKKIIIIVVMIVVGYAYVSNKVVNNGVNVIKDHNNQLEEVMNSMN